LQNSGIKGQRHLNERERRQFDQKQKAEALQERLRSLLPPNYPLRRKDSESEISNLKSQI
jgi:hypothetical protein